MPMPTELPVPPADLVAALWWVAWIAAGSVAFVFGALITLVWWVIKRMDRQNEACEKRLSAQQAQQSAKDIRIFGVLDKIADRLRDLREIEPHDDQSDSDLHASIRGISSPSGRHHVQPLERNAATGETTAIIRRVR